MDRGAWHATVHGGAKESYTTKQLNNNNKLFLPCFIFTVLRSQCSETLSFIISFLFREIPTAIF